MSISWGKRERYKFLAGGALSNWVPPMLSAVYAITYKQDPHNKPKSHTVLYFGEAEDLSQQSSMLNKKVLDFWTNGNGTSDDLYVFVHPMSGSTKIERKRIKEKLVIDYRPHINDL